MIDSVDNTNTVSSPGNRSRDAVTLDQLVGLLAAYRFTYTSERELQDGIEAVLRAHRVSHRREHGLSGADRPDFVVEERLIIEVKTQGSFAEMLRQGARYGRHPNVSGILVVGTPHWLTRVPPNLSGKPVRALRLLGSLL